MIDAPKVGGIHKTRICTGQGTFETDSFDCREKPNKMWRKTVKRKIISKRISKSIAFIISLALVLTTALSLLTGTARAATITITTAAELAKIGNDTSYPRTGEYILGNDINLTEYLSADGDGYNGGAGWLPIGTWDEPFTGTFDGKGYVISGLWINRPSGEYVGLF
jgi:hypothetical protein